MATSGPTSVLSFLGNDADFQSWVTAVHNALVACGMTQTTDTGQINPATVTRPAVNVAAGYEIWRFSDSLQSALPIFFKIEYGIAAGADRPSLWVTAGTSSSGAGAITGQATARTQCRAGNSDVAASTRAMVAQGDSGQIHLYCNDPGAGSVAYGFGFNIERTRDAVGAKTADGFTVLWIDGGATSVQHLPSAGTVPAAVSSGFYVVLTAGRTVVGTDVIMSPVLCPLGKWYYNFLHFMAAADMAFNTVFTADVLGAVHTFRACKATAADYLMIPWE